MSDNKKLSKKDKYQESLKAYQDVMKVFREGNFSKAAEMFDSFIKDYDEEQELVDRAKIYRDICLGRMNKEEIKLENFDDYYYYSLFQANRGNYDEALKSIEKAKELKPDDGRVYYLMADIYCLMNKTDECLNSLKKAIQLDKFFGILAQNEKDFEPLWEDKKFKLIIRMT